MRSKAQGAAFRTRAMVKSSDFKWFTGDSLIKFYEPSRGTYGGFRRVCGSRALTKFKEEPSYYGLPLGALDNDADIRFIRARL